MITTSLPLSTIHRIAAWCLNTYSPLLHSKFSDFYHLSMTLIWFCLVVHLNSWKRLYKIRPTNCGLTSKFVRCKTSLSFRYLFLMDILTRILLKLHKLSICQLVFAIFNMYIIVFIAQFWKLITVWNSFRCVFYNLFLKKWCNLLTYVYLNRFFNFGWNTYNLLCSHSIQNLQRFADKDFPNLHEKETHIPNLH